MIIAAESKAPMPGVIDLRGKDVGHQPIPVPPMSLYSVPRLMRRKGVGEDAIHMLLVDNPRRVLAFV